MTIGRGMCNRVTRAGFWPQGPGCRTGRGLGHISDAVQHQIMGQVKDARGGDKAQRMGLAHETGADQADTQLRFGHFRWSRFTIRAGSSRPAKKSSTFCAEDIAIRSAA